MESLKDQIVAKIQVLLEEEIPSVALLDAYNRILGTVLNFLLNEK